jgi:hypothetical protein
VNDVNKIVADALEAGQIPWRFASACLPRQIVSSRLFSAVNPILLQIGATRINSSSPWWATEILWELVGHTVIASPDDGVQLPGEQDAVFNLDQTIGEYPLLPPKQVDPKPAFEALVERAKIKIEHVYDTVCEYVRDEDKIRIPCVFLFQDGPGGIEGYFFSLAHEIMHFSESRTGWAANDVVNELRAEIGSAYFCAALGITPVAAHLRRHHDKFAAAWAADLRAHPELICHVCNNATATVAWLFKVIGMEVKWEMHPGSQAWLDSYDPS